jgi:ADP-ribose pyrophosphatase YjhB (NUDIX family)
VPVVRAAGGLLWRSSPAGRLIAIIHRPRRDDWSLPKGKLTGGEGWEEAALREVKEETGCRARITGFAGASNYLSRRGPKLVLYWHMELVRESQLDAGDEVDELDWVSPSDALKWLDYESDRRLLVRALGGSFGARARGASAIARVRADLLRLSLRPSVDGASVGSALELLDEAEEFAPTADPNGLRALLLAVRWLGLYGLEAHERAPGVAQLKAEVRRLALVPFCARSRDEGTMARRPAAPPVRSG